MVIHDWHVGVQQSESPGISRKIKTLNLWFRDVADDEPAQEKRIDSG